MRGKYEGKLRHMSIGGCLIQMRGNNTVRGYMLDGNRGKKGKKYGCEGKGRVWEEEERES